MTDAGDGPSALAAYDAEPPDLVILDLMLPGMQGETVLEALRDAGDVPVLITSAKRSDAERIAGLRAGADDYLAKPFNPHELTARVAAILRRTRSAETAAPPPILSSGGRPARARSRLAPLHAGGRGERPADARRGVAARGPGRTIRARCSARQQLLERGGATARRGVRAGRRRPRRQPAPQARRRRRCAVADRDGAGGRLPAGGGRRPRSHDARPVPGRPAGAAARWRAGRGAPAGGGRRQSGRVALAGRDARPARASNGWSWPARSSRRACGVASDERGIDMRSCGGSRGTPAAWSASSTRRGTPIAQGGRLPPGDRDRAR